ncbi:MAG: OmpA family protein [Muribaculaceae bacterium]|nr:OmpA family protein [Muribaculaceae bacterium]
MSKKQESYFWTSYSDLMTSLFFVMLVLFVLACAMLKNKIDEVEKQKEATEKELAKIREIEESIQAIDPKFFEYNSTYKKHILKINVQFQKRSADISDIPDSKQKELIAAGRSISRFLQRSSEDVKYLLVIEGQASNDNYPLNDELSYNRANSLKHLWSQNNIDFGNKCEIIVCGSGKEGVMRSQPDNASNEKNQRFLIHIIPKPGIIERIEKSIDSNN